MSTVKTEEHETPSTSSGQTAKQPRFALPEWVPLSVLSMIGAGQAALLEEKAESIALEVDRPTDGSGPRVLTKHLGALLPPAIVKLAREYKPEWGALPTIEFEDLGFTSLTDRADVVRLCKLRGVLFDGEEVDRRGLEMLVRLLKREERFPKADWDWILCCIVNSHLKEVMFTQAKWEADPPPLPEPREPEPWENPARPDTRRFIHRGERYNPYEEPMNRCLCLGIRTATPGKGERGPSCLGFDLFRRLGLVLDRHLMPPWKLEAYREMMVRSYDDVFARAKELTNV
jgi:hypothetical protein